MASTCFCTRCNYSSAPTATRESPMDHVEGRVGKAAVHGRYHRQTLACRSGRMSPPRTKLFGCYFPEENDKCNKGAGAPDA
eukprot:2105145-Amphidinium_carterae.1